MKYTRYEYVNLNGINRRRVILKFLLIAPTAALIAGFVISRLIIVPYVLKTGEKKAEAPVAVQQTDILYQDILNRKYYIVQMGAFASKENAHIFSENLRKKGIPVFVGNEGQYHLIITFAGSNLNYAKSKADYYSTSGYSCIVKELTVTAKGAPEELRNEKWCIVLSRLFNACGTLIDSYCQSLQSFEDKEIDYNALMSGIKEPGGEVHKWMKEWEVLDNAEANYDIFIKAKALDEIIKHMEGLENSPDFSMLFQEKIMEALYKYSEMAYLTNEIY